MTKTTDDLDDRSRSETGSAQSHERQFELEERIRKLETALGQQSIPALVEESVAERMLAKLSAIAASSEAPPGTERVLVLAPKDDAPPPPTGAVLHPPETSIDPIQRMWLLTQLVAEVRLMFHMYFDPRYRISRTTQFAIPGIALLLLFNYFLFATWVNISVVSPIAERLLDVILCAIGYKLLTRELARYRNVLHYLARFSVH